MNRPPFDEDTLVEPPPEDGEGTDVIPLEPRLRMSPVRLGPLAFDRLLRLEEFERVLNERERALAQLEEEAQSRGYRAGVQQAVQERMDAFYRELQALDARMDEWESRLLQEIPRQAARLAAFGLGRELAFDDAFYREWVRQQAKSLLPAVSVQCRFCLQDEARIAGLQESFRQEFPHVGFCWQADARLQPGEIVMESENLKADGRLDVLQARFSRLAMHPDEHRPS